MKTQILQLEAHDDVISILDKIGWTQAERVLLVLPRRRRVLNHKLDLLRLKRQSQKKGCQLAIVTDDPLIKALAREVNLPIYHSIQKAHQAEWTAQPYSELSPQIALTLNKPPLIAQVATIQALRASNGSILPIWARFMCFNVAILAVISILGILAPSAIIHITPPLQQQSISIPIVATRRVQQARISGEVPISLLRISVAGDKTVKTNGTITLPKDFAKGEVLLTNLTDQPIEVPAGTILRTLDQKPRRYATQQTVFLKTGNEKSASVVVQALEAGSAQNVQPNEIKAVEGLLGLKISVENPQPIEGGNNMMAPAPSAQDRKLLSRELQAELLEKAKGKVSQEMQNGDLLLPDSAIQIRVIQQQYTPDETIAADFLSLHLELEVVFGVVTRQTLMDLGNQLLASSLPSGYTPLHDTLFTACQGTFAQTENGDYRCTLEISRQIQPSIDPEQVRNLIVGKSIQSASRQLHQAYKLSKPPDIEIFPQWLPVLPWLPMRIEIVIEK